MKWAEHEHLGMESGFLNKHWMCIMKMSFFFFFLVSLLWNKEKTIYASLYTVIVPDECLHALFLVKPVIIIDQMWVDFSPSLHSTWISSREYVKLFEKYHFKLGDSVAFC